MLTRLALRKPMLMRWVPRQCVRREGALTRPVQRPALCRSRSRSGRAPKLFAQVITPNRDGYRQHHHRHIDLCAKKAPLAIDAALDMTRSGQFAGGIFSGCNGTDRAIAAAPGAGVEYGDLPNLSGVSVCHGCFTRNLAYQRDTSGSELPL
jgi:hypothetical protein